ncbi:MAG: hypothetical protein ACHRXM_37135 [Isosphaerales bacterium]
MKYYQKDNPAMKVTVLRELLENTIACHKDHQFKTPEVAFRTLGMGLYEAFGHFSTAQLNEGIIESKLNDSSVVVLESVPYKDAAEEAASKAPPVPAPVLAPSAVTTVAPKETAAVNGETKPN